MQASAVSMRTRSARVLFECSTMCSNICQSNDHACTDHCVQLFGRTHDHDCLRLVRASDRVWNISQEELVLAHRSLSTCSNQGCCGGVELRAESVLGLVSTQIGCDAMIRRTYQTNSNTSSEVKRRALNDDIRVAMINGSAGGAGMSSKHLTVVDLLTLQGMWTEVLEWAIRKNRLDDPQNVEGATTLCFI